MKSKSLNLRMDLQALPDEAVIPRKEKGFGEEKEMKKRIVLFSALIFLCSMFTMAVCEETRGSSSIASILNAWGAKDGQELYTRILDHWNRNIDGTRISWPAKIRLGGTTEDLISKPGSWDLAIVSSKDVDLQKLADEGLFDPDYKREIEKHPKNIAVVTSPTGAAVRDIIKIAGARNSSVSITVVPVLVQGESAGWRFGREAE